MSNFRIHFFSAVMTMNVTILYVGDSTLVFGASLFLILAMWLLIAGGGVKK